MTRGDQAMFSCTVNFQLPKEEITYSWKFAGGGVSWSGASALVLGGGLCFIEDGESGRSGELGLDSGFVQRFTVQGPGVRVLSRRPTTGIRPKGRVKI